MWSFVTPLRLKRANIFLSNYLEQRSPHIDGLHSCLAEGSPIKNPSESKKFEKRQKKGWWWWFGYIKKKKRKDYRCLEKKNKKKKEKWWTHKRQMNLWCNIIQRSFFRDTITSFWVFTIHICFHTLSLDHDTSIIKPTQIQDWLSVPFKKFKSWKSFWRAERFVHNLKKEKMKNRFWDLLSKIQAVFDKPG